MADSFWNHLETTIGADRLNPSYAYNQPAQVNNQVDDIDPWRKNATIEDWKKYLFSTSSYQAERPGLESAPRCDEMAKVQNAYTRSMLNPSHSVSVDTKKYQGAYIPFPRTLNGGYTSQINGKRERTIYTSEQVAALEKNFHVRPYVNREERQALQKKLQISDDAIKVWFQNRRTKGKKEPMTYYPPSDKFNNNITRDPLAHVESLLHKPDKYGYVTLDDRAISELVTAIDRCLPKDLNLELLNGTKVVKEETRRCVSERACAGLSTNPYYHHSWQTVPPWTSPK